MVEAGIAPCVKAGLTTDPSAGLPELRQAIAEMSAAHGGEVTSDEVVVVPGGKPIIFFTMLALADVGDESYLSQSWLPDL